MTNDRYGKIHTDGSRSGGQPVVARQKAHTAMLEVLAEWGIEWRSATQRDLTVATTTALCRAIEQHEAFKQEVSDIAASALAMYRRVGEDRCMTAQDLRSLIIPKPKPDPLVEIMEAYGWYGSPTAADNLRTALADVGLEIREKNT